MFTSYSLSPADFVVMHMIGWTDMHSSAQKQLTVYIHILNNIIYWTILDEISFIG